MELGVQPHVSILQLALHGVKQVAPPHAIAEVTWPGTFTVDAGALTLVTRCRPSRRSRVPTGGGAVASRR